jgi:hypothetical protein
MHTASGQRQRREAIVKLAEAQSIASLTTLDLDSLRTVLEEEFSKVCLTMSSVASTFCRTLMACQYITLVHLVLEEEFSKVCLTMSSHCRRS